jgi:hypothetical protein
MFASRHSNIKKPSFRFAAPALALAIFFNWDHAYAQQAAAAELPDAPQTSPASQVAIAPGTTTPAPHSDPQTKRILGIFPNFIAVSAQTHLPPQSVKDKFVTASEDSFDYSALPIPLLIAGESQATNATPEFHSGAPAYGRYVWHTFLDQTSENYWVEFLVPVATREDTRYYTLGPGGGDRWKRMGYALSRVAIIRDDAGHDTFNLSEVVGAGAAAGVANLYYPRPERTLSNTVDKWTVNLGVDAVGFAVREFWPDINHVLFHGNQPLATH